jgi:hypothetical protein
MERVYIAWTVENWITVSLMAAGALVIFMLGSQAYRNFTGKS